MSSDANAPTVAIESSLALAFPSGAFNGSAMTVPVAPIAMTNEDLIRIAAASPHVQIILNQDNSVTNNTTNNTTTDNSNHGNGTNSHTHNADHSGLHRLESLVVEGFKGVNQLLQAILRKSRE
jgi:hypothetical protein